MSKDDMEAEDDLSPAAREVWSDIKSARDWDALNEGSDALASQMSPQDIDPLISIGHRGTAEERYAALRALLGVARTPEALSAEQKTRLVNAAYVTVQEFYPGQSLGTTSLRILYEHDRKKAEEFLLEEFEPGELTLSALKEFVKDLVQFRGISVLQALRTREGEFGLVARSGLERLGIIDPADLDAAFKEWRAKRTADALHRVCNLYVYRLREGHPWPEFLEALGTPTGQEGMSYWWDAVDYDVRLLVQADETVGVVAWKLMD
jgi:hypothetical protein